MTFLVPTDLCHDAQRFLESNPEVKDYLTLETRRAESGPAKLLDSHGHVVAAGCNQCFGYLKAAKKESAKLREPALATS